jgi:hypothetical protein
MNSYTTEWIINMYHARLHERFRVVFRNGIKVYSLKFNQLQLRVSKHMSQP